MIPLGVIAKGPAAAPAIGAMAAWNSAGTLLSSATLPTTHSVNVQTHSAGDLLILLALARNTENNGDFTMNTADWAPIGTGVYGGTQNARIRAWRKIGNGSETTVSITGTGGTGTDRAVARVHRFTAANGFAATPIQPASPNTNASGTSATTSISMPTVVASNINQLGVCVYGANVSTTVGAATGESGGDWTEPVAESATTNGMIGIQTASLAGGGTISGGGATVSSAQWVSLAFSLVPAGTPVPGMVTQGLVGEWRFNDGAGQVLTDYSGNNRHGQLGSTAGVDAADPAWSGGGLDFDGTDDYVDLPVSGMPTGNADITMQVVVKMPSSGLKGTANMCAVWGGGTRGMFTLAYNTGSNEARILTEGDDLNYVLPSPPTWPDLVWMITGRHRASDNHLSVVFQEMGQEGTKTLGGPMNLGSSGFRFGTGISGAEPHKGLLLWGASYSAFLTDAQIVQNYNYAKNTLGIPLP